VSAQRTVQLRAYSGLRKQFLADHPICQVWLVEHGWEQLKPSLFSHKPSQRVLDAYDMLITGAPAATEVHHKNGRTGERLNDFAHCMAVSRSSHEWIHANATKARAKGFLF